MVIVAIGDVSMETGTLTKYRSVDLKQLSCKHFCSHFQESPSLLGVSTSTLAGPTHM